MSWNRWAWNPPKRATDVEQTPCFWIARFALWRRCCRSSFFFAFGLLCRLSPPRSITVSFLRLACLSIYLVLSSFDHILKWQCRQCLWFADEAKQHSPNNNKMTMMMIFLRHFSFFLCRRCCWCYTFRFGSFFSGGCFCIQPSVCFMNDVIKIRVAYTYFDFYIICT